MRTHLQNQESENSRSHHETLTRLRYVVTLAMSQTIVILIPVLLLLLSVRLVMTDLYLRLEYQRPGFPADRYGWDSSVRLDYGHYGIRYLLSSRDIAYLRDLEIEGKTAFAPDELAHMEDVKGVTRAAMLVLTVSLMMFIVFAGFLLYRSETRPAFLRAVSQGGFGTLGIAGMLMILALVSWDFFFDSFHAMFFDAGTWRFHNSDTLIRLYPPQFWFDSAIVVGVLTIGGALLCAFVPRWWLRRQARHVTVAE